jgi:hypothetical protein
MPISEIINRGIIANLRHEHQKVEKEARHGNHSVYDGARSRNPSLPRTRSRCLKQEYGEVLIILSIPLPTSPWKGEDFCAGN